jgi:hypothetical protein
LGQDSDTNYHPHTICIESQTKKKDRAAPRQRQVATFRLWAAFYSKTLSRFGGWSAWQSAGYANRWAADSIEHLVE